MMKPRKLCGEGGGAMTSYAQKIGILSHFNDKNASNWEF